MFHLHQKQHPIYISHRSNLDQKNLGRFRWSSFSEFVASKRKFRQKISDNFKQQKLQIKKTSDKKKFRQKTLDKKNFRQKFFFWHFFLTFFATFFSAEPLDLRGSKVQIIFGVVVFANPFCEYYLGSTCVRNEPILRSFCHKIMDPWYGPKNKEVWVQVFASSILDVFTDWYLAF